MLKFERDAQTAAKLIVVGIGGGGGNAVNTMIESDIKDISYVAINTDKQDLDNSKAEQTLQIGEKTTGGLGAGGKPEIGQASADENIQDIEALIQDSDMVFITAGMGGGTGTGAAPVIAKLAKDLGKLTVGIVTKPFIFEGKQRGDNAELGINYLKKFVDSLVIVPNDKLLEISTDVTTMEDAFAMANDVLRQGVQGITDLITRPGLINLDFADVRTVMSNRGLAHMGIGIGEGDDKVAEAVEHAIHSPLLETSINGAQAILLNIAGSSKLGILELNKAAAQITATAPGANVIVGTSIDDSLEDKMTITVIATGFEDDPEVLTPDFDEPDKASVATSSTASNRNDNPSSPFAQTSPSVAATPYSSQASASTPSMSFEPKDETADFDANINLINGNNNGHNTVADDVSENHSSDDSFGAGFSNPFANAANDLSFDNEDKEEDAFSIPGFLKRD
ncbi:MAG: cell division protein FtsZ [Clostridiales Family XIII bacterium]|jgi:cell division protein FtsZ|nr:cell division protein FtsZ [Clostridiales Family XIII bacterium]